LAGEDRDGAAGTITTATDRHPESSDLQRLAYSVDEAAAILGVARETIYELIRRGELRSRKAGSRRIIGRHHLIEFLDGGEPRPDRQAS
jgi:excisionase family DNA binding protein